MRSILLTISIFISTYGFAYRLNVDQMIYLQEVEIYKANPIIYTELGKKLWQAGIDVTEGRLSFGRYKNFVLKHGDYISTIRGAMPSKCLPEGGFNNKLVLYQWCLRHAKELGIPVAK